MAEIIEELIGRQLASVVFVSDYVQLFFGSPFPILTYFVNPVLVINGLSISSQNSDWRNALCSFIRDTVKNVACDKKRTHVEVIFISGKKIIVDMGENNPLGEMLTYASCWGGPLTVW